MRNIFFLLLLAQTSIAQPAYQIKIHFDQDKFSLRPDAVVLLDALYNKLKLADSLEIKLTGYCDSVGSLAYNKALSKKRANAVRNYFLSKGVNINSEDWLGETKPCSIKDSLNRRVEIFIRTIPKKHKRISHFKSVEDLEKLRKGDVFILKEMKFVLGKTTVIGNADSILKPVYELMVKHPQVEILIMGHVCCNDDNLLSINRSIKIKELLTYKGICPERISTCGYGNRRPLVIEKTKQDEQKNRRVEVKILKV